MNQDQFWGEIRTMSTSELTGALKLSDTLCRYYEGSPNALIGTWFLRRLADELDARLRGERARQRIAIEQ